jgi:hypothetical protein
MDHIERSVANRTTDDALLAPFALDIDNAFPNFALAPSDVPLQGFTWRDITDPQRPPVESLTGDRGSGGADVWAYFLAALCFGVAPGTQLFMRFSTCLVWIMVTHLELDRDQLSFIVDDFMYAGWTAAGTGLLDDVLNLWKELGVPVKAKKTQRDTTTIRHRGILFHFLNRTMEVPREKLTRLLEQLQVIVTSQTVPFALLESIVGLAVHCSYVMAAGRLFSHHMLAALRKARQQDHRTVKVTPGLRSDATWWTHNATGWNGRSLCSAHNHLAPTRFSSHADANLERGGAVFDTHWLVFAFPPALCTTSEAGIAARELYAQLVLLTAMAHLWEGSRVSMFCDNDVVNSALENLGTRDHVLNTLLHALHSAAAARSIGIHRAYVNTHDNTASDALTRCTNNAYAHVFWNAMPQNADNEPFQLPLLTLPEEWQPVPVQLPQSFFAARHR